METSWWQKLRQNALARFGATVLLVFYLVVIFAEFTAPYDPYGRQPNGSLLPPTTIYWRSQETGQFIGPHVYPITQGPVDVETGNRVVEADFSEPSPIRFFVKGEDYRFLKLTLPTVDKVFIPEENAVEAGDIQIGPWAVTFGEFTPFPGIAGNLHLLGTTGTGKWNLLGTDESARDVLSRLIHGGRISLSIGLIGIMISFPLGLLVGGISGYFGGIIDSVLMRIVEVIMTIPSIYLLVTLSGALSARFTSSQRFFMIVVILSFVGWAGLARVIRGNVLSLRERTFVQASQAMGGRSIHIILRHILPQTATYVIISATLAVPGYILAEAVLSLIGLGIQQPDPSWGNMLSSATNASVLILHPWLIWPPAFLIVATVLAFNLLGDGLRDALDPRSLKE
ncbi:MAG: ABC transporter permease [Cyanobacteria bacterium J06628_6]